MEKVGRNQPCPCGSGKKYKQCCGGAHLEGIDKTSFMPMLMWSLQRRGAIQLKDVEMTSAAVLDESSKQLIRFTEDMLINQLNRDSLEIEQSFDDLCMDDLKQLSRFLSQTAAILHGGIIASINSNDELRLTCGQVLLNALSSFVATVQLLRSGYRLQPGILVREIIESLCIVLHLVVNPDDLGRLKHGKFQSTTALATAKKFIPLFGNLYGFFSSQYTHIGKFHLSIQPVIKYSGKDEALTLNLSFLRISLWLLYITSELTYYDLVISPRYWESLNHKGFKYNPSTKEKKWLRDFLGDVTEEEM